MNKILNWIFGACFRTLGRFLAIFIVFVLLLFVGSKLDFELPSWLRLSVNASTITSYDTYKNYQNGSSSCGSSGKYSYTTTLPNVQGGNLWESASLNTTISGQAHDIVLSFNSSLLANSYYDITINFMSNDLRYTVKRDNLTLYSGSSCQDFSTNNLALVSFTNTATSSKNTNKLTFRVYSSSVSTYWSIKLTANNNEYLTSVNNFGIKNIDVVQIEDNSTEDIINNQTNNTENIINNSNSNTEKLENTIKDQFQDCRDSVNILDVTTNNKDITCQYCGLVFGTYTIEQGQTYTLSFNTNNNGGKVYIHENSGFSWGEIATTGGRVSMTLTALQSGTFRTALVIASGANVTTPYNLTQIQLEKGNSATQYEEFGKQVCKNKLDDVNQSIQDTNNNIMNSTSPDVSGMTDLAGYLPPGPLDSVLNLPLSILNSLNSKLSSSCIPLTLILPFVNLPLNIPCLSTIFSQIEGLNILWESLGVILGALIMYKYLVYLYNWVDDVTSLKHTHARLFGAKSDADNWGGVE